jgi:cell division protein FtsW (lipid II flippase)
MSPERHPVFLARRTYRHRRLADAARLLPLAAGVLMILPLLWQGPDEDPGTAMVMFYIFGLWVALAGLAALLSRYLRASEPETGGPDREDT